MPTILIKDAHKTFGDNAVLRGVDLAVETGGRLGIIGAAGSGKSVLLKLIVGLLELDSGTIELLGESISIPEVERMRLRKRVGMLFQNYALFDYLSAVDNVAFPLLRIGVPHNEAHERASDRLRAVGLSNSAAKFPSELSGGMKKRLGIARATITQPEVLLCDELTAGLDPVTTAKMYDLLHADQAASGATIVAVSSDIDAVVANTDTIAMVHKGTIRYFGPASEIRTSNDPTVRSFVTGTDTAPPSPGRAS